MERDLMGKAKRPAIVQRLGTGRRTDANRAVVSPLPRLAIATEKDWIYFYPRRSVGPSGLEYLLDHFISIPCFAKPLFKQQR